MMYRFMRAIVFFDLPTLTAEDKREYRLFRKVLLENGFYMMQESVYCRLLLNPNALQAAVETIRKHAPPRVWFRFLPSRKSNFPKWNM